MILYKTALQCMNVIAFVAMIQVILEITKSFLLYKEQLNVVNMHNTIIMLRQQFWFLFVCFLLVFVNIFHIYIFFILVPTYGPGPHAPGPLIIWKNILYKSNMFQDHIENTQCSRSIQETCSWSSMHPNNASEDNLTYNFLLGYLVIDGPYGSVAYGQGAHGS